METTKANKWKVPYIERGSIIGEEEIDAVSTLLFSDDTLSCGPQRDRFEEEFASFVGTKYAFTVPNCTVALEFATYLAKLSPGDEVIAAPISYQASIAPLLAMPITVRFCDIDSNSLAIDPVKLKSLINVRTRAIYLTHFGGLMADMDAIIALANQHNILVIEDCAHALGSEYKSRMAGSTAHISCFSFTSIKSMSTLGEGGMITFNNSEYAAIVRRIRAIEPDAQFETNPKIQFGSYLRPRDGVFRHEKNSYTHDCIGISHPGTNATMSEPAAAVGRIQLRKLSQFNTRRRQIAHQLNAGLSEILAIRLQKEPRNVKHVYHLYTCFVTVESGINRDKLAKALQDEGIEIVLRYFPIHLLPEWRYRGHKYGECPVAEKIWFEQLLNLPCYPSLTKEQVEYMIYAMEKVVRKLHK